MKQKLFTLLFAIVANVGMILAASSGTCGENLTWTLSDDGILTISGTGDMANYTSGKAPWSAEREAVRQVVIGNSVTSIGNCAFSDCAGMTSVTIGNGVTSIGTYAFSGCTSLTSVLMGNSIANIKNYAFYGCTGLTSIAIPNSVTSIGSSAFSGCTGLTSVTIPNSVTSIGSSTFRNCTGLTSITIPNSVTSIGDNAFYGCTGLTSIAIPNSVTSIGTWAFSGCTGLTSITIPNSVTSIGNNAFRNVPNVVYSGTASGSPWGAKSVNGYVDGYFVYRDNTKTELLGCSLAVLGEITILNSVTSIGDNAFYGCTGLTSIAIPNSVTSIGSSAFSGCTGLTSITIPNSVTSIGDNAFYGCTGLTSIAIPNSVTSIGSSTFRNCTGLTSITIPNSVTSIGDNAFYGCTGLTSIAIPNSVTSIGSSAFSGCTGLTSIAIPNSVTSIGSSAFSGCTGLTHVNISNLVAWCHITFGNNTANPLFYAKHLYLNGSEITNLIIPNSVTSIGSYAFYGCTSLTSVTVPNSVTSIGTWAFSGCTGLTSVTIPNSVTSIGNNAFRDCTGLTSITIPNSVTSIGTYAFCNCTGLTYVAIPNSVTSIGMYTFRDCTDLTSITIPNSVTSIGNGAFYNCTGLTSITIPNSVTSIGGSAFSGCTGLTSITIPNSVTSIGGSAFYGCTGFTFVTCKATTPPSLSSNPFNNVDKSIPLYVPAGSVETYQTTNYWKTFTNILPIESSSTYCQLTVTSADETMGEVNQVSGTYEYQTEVNLIATSKSNYQFVQWSDGNTDNPRTLILTKDIVLTAIFAIDIKSGTCGENYALTWIHNPIAKTLDIYGVGALTENYTYSDYSDLLSLTISNGVTSIGNSAFQNYSGLTSITIPNSVTSIGDSAFSGCTGLITGVSVPSSVTKIGYGAFYNVKAIFYCGSATGAPWGAKDGSGVMSKIVLEDLYYDINYCDHTAKVRCKSEEIVKYSCSRCNPSGAGRQWDHYHLSYMNFNNGWTITKADIPDSIKYEDTYYHVTTIDKFAFYHPFSGNTSLKSVSIPQSVMSIEGGAFALCSGLMSVTCYATVPPSMGTVSWSFEEKYWDVEWLTGKVTDLNDNSYIKTYGVFGEVDCSQIPLYVPRASVEAYRAANQWKDFNVKSIDGNYVITFQNWDGTELLVLDVIEDSIPVYIGATPTRPEDDEYVYTFSGWTPSVKAATNNATYTATYTATRKSFTITWLNEDGSLIDKTTVEYGMVPTHANPTKAATAEFTYSFAGWTPQVVAVTGDATYTATFSSTVNKYNITATAVNGSVEGTGTYPYGSQVKLTAVPNYGYHFTKWSDGNTENPRTVVLTQNMTFTAEFAADKSGTCGKNNLLQWTFGNDGTLTISGNGELTENYTYGAEAPTRMQNLVIREGITSIGQRAFTGYNSIKSISLGKDVVSIGQNAFTGCNSIKRVEWNAINSSSWNFGSQVETFTFGEEVSVIPANLCSGMKNLTEIKIPKTVLSIGNDAFNGCENITSLTFPTNLTSIGNYAFADINNRQLMSLVMPAELCTIGDYAFSGNTYVESIDFNAKLQSIGAYAFKDCYRVSEMTCLAVVTPDVGSNALTSIDANASLCVPAECLRKYKVDPNWGRFDLCELGSTTTTTDTKVVTVEPTDNTALFIWPTENNAGAYTLKISKDGEVFCTLVFNSNGQLTGIAFAPGRNGAAHAPAATTSVAGMSFTVTGLNSASKYAYHLTVADENDKKIQAYSGEFATTGYQGEVNPGGQPENPISTALDQTSVDQTPTVTKFIRDGQLFILRDSKTYTVQGQEVK